MLVTYYCVSVDSDFDDWKEFESKVDACGMMSGSCEDAFLDKEMQRLPNALEN